MNAYEELRAAWKIINGGHALQGSAPGHTWPIGEGRVTTEEFESWQLGPDFSDSEPRKQSVERRHS